MAQEEGEEEHCENRSLPEVCIFLHQPSKAAPPIYARPLRDYCSHLPSFPSPGDCSVEWGASYHTRQTEVRFKEEDTNRKSCHCVRGDQEKADGGHGIE